MSSSVDPAGSPVIAVTARYFAAFRERAGREQEPLETRASTAAALFDEVAARHGFGAVRGRGLLLALDLKQPIAPAIVADFGVEDFPPDPLGTASADTNN